MPEVEVKPTVLPPGAGQARSLAMTLRMLSDVWKGVLNQASVDVANKRYEFFQEVGRTLDACILKQTKRLEEMGGVALFGIAVT